METSFDLVCPKCLNIMQLFPHPNKIKIGQLAWEISKFENVDDGPLVYYKLILAWMCWKNLFKMYDKSLNDFSPGYAPVRDIIIEDSLSYDFTSESLIKPCTKNDNSLVH